MKTRLNNATISTESTIRQAMESLTCSTLKICMVTDSSDRVQGIITDGDVRRGLLRGLTLSDIAIKIMNRDFNHVINDIGYRPRAHVMAKKLNLDHVPILDTEGRIVDIIYNSRHLRHETKDNIVLIMAGGLGVRLRPLTENCPKPLLKIGERPILESIILNFKAYGFHNFYISINYLGHMIADYFGNGMDLGVNIQYIKESRRLGTAGALSLLPQKPSQPFFVVNGDVVLQADMDDILMQHIDNKVAGTMCIRQYNVKIPYGVVKTDGRYITEVLEKPSKTYFINAGLYCLGPDVLEFVPGDSFFDMTSLFEIATQNGHKTTTYLMEGPWIDIGNIDDYNHACENSGNFLSHL